MLMKLSQLSDKSSPIKQFVARLAKTTKQRAISVVAHKARRVSGVSARSFEIHLENGQVVAVWVRILNDAPDIFRIDLNAKQLPTTGDFSVDYMPAFNQSVDEVAVNVVQGQSAFDKKRAAVKVKRAPTKGLVSQRQQLIDLQRQADDLQRRIDANQDKIDELKSRINEV